MDLCAERPEEAEGAESGRGMGNMVTHICYGGSHDHVIELRVYGLHTNVAHSGACHVYTSSCSSGLLLLVPGA